MRLLLVVNSFASSVNARNTVVVHRLLSRNHEVEIVETNRRGHAIRFAQDAARRGLDAVVAFGGDGTLNEVATGLAGTTTALAALPGGSTNVFARTIGMANDPVVATNALLAGLQEDRIEPIGLGRVNGRFFCFHVGIGFDAAVVAHVERHASLKRWLGHPLFIWSSAMTWARGYDRSRSQFAIDDLSTGQRLPGLFTVVLNTGPYTYLGNRPLDLAPGARLQRGLTAVTFSSLRLPTLGAALMSAVRGRSVATVRDVTEWSPAHHLHISAADDDIRIPFQVDGDYLGDTETLDIDYVEGAVRLVWPGSASEVDL
ncbi:MAG: diacylglycerol/lipid kinase family protein [Ilumatobacteraceae bacterium]